MPGLARPRPAAAGTPQGRCGVPLLRPARLLLPPRAASRPETPPRAPAFGCPAADAHASDGLTYRKHSPSQRREAAATQPRPRLIPLDPSHKCFCHRLHCPLNVGVRSTCVCIAAVHVPMPQAVAGVRDVRHRCRCLRPRSFTGGASGVAVASLTLKSVCLLHPHPFRRRLLITDRRGLPIQARPLAFAFAGCLCFSLLPAPLLWRRLWADVPHRVPRWDARVP